jgi:hypothetical protein
MADYNHGNDKFEGWKYFRVLDYYLRPRPTNHNINPTINTTTKIPTQTPALKMPPTTSQEDKVIAVANAKSPNKEYFFMSSSFLIVMQKICRFIPRFPLMNDGSKRVLNSFQ